MRRLQEQQVRPVPNKYLVSWEKLVTSKKWQEIQKKIMIMACVLLALVVVFIANRFSDGMERKRERAEILTEFSEALKDGEWLLTLGRMDAYISDGDPLKFGSDPEFLSIYNEAKKQAKDHYVNLVQTTSGEERAKAIEILIRIDPSEIELEKELREYRTKMNEIRLQAEQMQASETAESNRKKNRENLIKAGFSAWDGSHIELKRTIKESMNDPKSFEHVETTYADLGSHLVVLTRFRGKNAFGGVVLNSVKAKADLHGRIIEIID